MVLAFGIFAAAVFGFQSHTALAAPAGDLCGGTGGNGEIASIEDRSFTLTENDGSSLVVTLSSSAMIKTSSGTAAVSDLKIGDRVTLVGDSHRDGTFTADFVMLCAATQGSPAQTVGQGETHAAAVQNVNPGAYEKVNGVIQTAIALAVILLWLGLCAFLLIKRRKSLVYVLFFTIFYVYLYKVVDYTLLQFQLLLLLQHFVPGLMLNGFGDGTNVNLIPLATLGSADIKTSLLNVLMMMPFGFGLPFITRFRLKKVVLAGVLVSIVIEFLQFVTGLMGNTSFRVADINDVIFNTAGVAIGYILFVIFIRVFRNTVQMRKISANPIVRYMIERPQR